MKPQLLELDLKAKQLTDIIFFKVMKKIIVPALAGTILLFSCKTDLEMVDAFADKERIPSITAKNIEIVYTELGQTKLHVIAPETQHYKFAEEPYTEFPKGITVYTFNDSLEVESQLTANFAIYYDEKKLWNAKYNVVAMNKKGEILNTEQLFWDETKKTIYSNDMVKITTGDGVIFGEGFDSDENFDNWVIKKTSGTIYVDDD
jgi:LPS export ABC transporter protein LptC